MRMDGDVRTGNAQPRVQGRDDLGDVAHVRGAAAEARRPGGVLAERVHRRGPVRGEVVVLEQRFVQRLGVLMSSVVPVAIAAPSKQRRTRSSRASYSGRVKARHSNWTTAFSGMMLVTCPASATIAGDPVVAGDLLAEQADGHLAEHGSVGGVHAQVRGRCCVGGLAGERRLVPAHGLGAGPGRVVGEPVLDRMDHQSQPDAVERAPLQHQHLAAAVLLGRGADGLERDAQFVHIAAAGPVPPPPKLRRSGCARRRGRCPGSASYSTHSATVRSPLPALAVKAVGSPAVPRSTVKPPSSSSAADGLR